MKWFKSVDVYPKLFWKGRDHQDTYCCVGIGENGSTILPTFRVESFDPSQPQSTTLWPIQFYSTHRIETIVSIGECY